MAFPKQCGVSTTPFTVAHPLPTTHIMFKTDGSITGHGFNLSYSLQACGGLLEGPTSSLVSPGYPGNYPPSSTCVWLLSFTPGSQIELTGHTFSLGRCAQCCPPTQPLSPVPVLGIVSL